jgi:DNA-binding beta-propeller fold protein YncE
MRHLACATLLALGTAAAAAATMPPREGPAENGSPAWFLQPSSTDPAGHTAVNDEGRITVHPHVTGDETFTSFRCTGSTVCQNRFGPNRLTLDRVQWRQTMGYDFAYPIHLPPGDGGPPSVGIDSKGNIWVYQRKAPGHPQLFKFDRNYKLVLTVGEDVIGHQDKPHGMAVDGEGNAWICDINGATVQKISPDGKLLQTFGVKGHRGDWDEAKGQRYLWQPIAIAFAPNGDIYIGQGHGNESPRDVDSDDPTNVMGAARVLHLDRSGNFIGQWFGDETGQGKFDQVHGLAVDPKTGDVWIGDREQYRIQVYNAEGKFLRTILTRNLSSTVGFDANGNPWMATGQDGQVLKLDRSGKVIGAVGNGMGIGPGQFIEAAYFAFDASGNIFVGDTSTGRVTELVAPRK